MSQRFSDAELAAEWWRTQLDAFVIGEYNKTFEPSWSEIDMADYERHGEIARTIRRFATLPHAHDPELAKKSALSPRIESGLSDPISSLEKALVRKLRQQRKNLVKPSTKEKP